MTGLPLIIVPTPPPPLSVLHPTFPLASSFHLGPLPASPANIAKPLPFRLSLPFRLPRRQNEDRVVDRPCRQCLGDMKWAKGFVIMCIGGMVRRKGADVELAVLAASG